MFKLIKISLCFVLFYFHSVLSWQTELSVLIDPGARECFHQYLIKDIHVELDYQVISGGEYDISVWVTSPTNRILLSEQQKTNGQPNFKTEETGEYRICFDNSISPYELKQVHFYIGSTDDFEDPHFKTVSMFNNQNARAQEDQLGDLEEKIETLRETFTKVTNNLEKAQRYQNVFKAYESIDRSVMEHNFERVNFYSIMNIVVLLIVGAIQVFMIRSLFEDKSKVGSVLRGSKSSGWDSRR